MRELPVATVDALARISRRHNIAQPPNGLPLKTSKLLKPEVPVDK